MFLVCSPQHSSHVFNTMFPHVNAIIWKCHLATSCKNEVPACKRDDVAMFLMCSEVPPEAQFSCIHNKLLAWKRNDLAMTLISLWSLGISLDQALDTLFESHKLQRGIGTRG